jgi:hypothetical protein
MVVDSGMLEISRQITEKFLRWKEELELENESLDEQIALAKFKLKNLKETLRLLREVYQPANGAGLAPASSESSVLPKKAQNLQGKMIFIDTYKFLFIFIVLYRL